MTLAARTESGGQEGKQGATRYGVHLRSWRRPDTQIVHHYGRAWRRGIDREDEEFEVSFVITADEAAELNAADNKAWLGMMGPGLKRGDRSGRYADRDRLIDDALAQIGERWNHHGAVEDGQPMDFDRPLLQNADGTRPQPTTS